MPHLPRLTPHRPIYLDNVATTPVDPAVREAMAPYLAALFGNPSNPSHEFGSEAADAVEAARDQVGRLISARADEIVFTSGATESNNLAVLGTARGARERGDHVVTTQVEHKSVLGPCRQLEREGFRVTYLPVDGYGRVDPDAVADAISTRTVLVSVMTANNEVGTIQPVADIARICGTRGVLFHTDAVQALGKLPVGVNDLGIDLLSASAHKMYGPKGAGVLYVRRRSRRTRLEPLCYGGGQEGGLRPGTPAVPSLVGFGAACAVAGESLTAESDRVRSLRDWFQTRIQETFPTARFHGHPTNRLPGLLSVSFPGLDGEALSYALHGVAVGRGSSCSAGTPEPSHVLTAMGIGRELSSGVLRFGIGRFNTTEDIDGAVDILRAAVKQLLTSHPPTPAR